MEMNSAHQIARLIDISAVRTDATFEEVKAVAEAAREYKFICAFAMPCFTKYLVKALENEPDIMVGGVVGFPSGQDTTTIKVKTAQELIDTGVNELDMVINVGELKSGKFDTVKNDIKAVVETAGGIPVKSILEIAYLSDEEIIKACELAVEAGVTYVKTGTGWGPRPTTVETIKLIKSAVGDKALIKAAGGVRSLDVLLDMVDAGCERFGIGLNSAKSIIEEAKRRFGK